MLVPWCGRAMWVFDVARKRGMRNAHRNLTDKLRQNTVAKYKHVGQNIFKILDKLPFQTQTGSSQPLCIDGYMNGTRSRGRNRSSCLLMTSFLFL